MSKKLENVLFISMHGDTKAALKEIRGFYTSIVSDSRTKVIIPLGPTIFSEAYGIVEDPFNVQIQLMFDPRL